MVSDEVMRRYPWVRWEEPIVVGEALGCRVCIAVRGVDELFADRRAFDCHWEAEHR